AAEAAGGWARTPVKERAAVLVRAADILDSHADEFGAELTREEGKTLPEGIAEVRRAAEILRFNAEEAHRPAGEMFHSPRRGERIIVARKPLGVVAAITPWNFPIAIPAWKIAPALVHGNVVVWKPASLVPLLAFRLAQALNDAGLPPGVLTLVIGPGRIGQALVEHPGVHALTFTGSTEIGTELMKTCAALRKPVQTEMGGKNAAVVLADADLDRAARAIVSGAMVSTGQKCTATSRLVVERDVEDDLLDRIDALVEALQVGDGLDPAVAIGPAASGSAQRDITRAVKHAQAEGATLRAQSALPRIGGSEDGYFVRPCVLTLPDTRAAVWREEVFGPVLASVSAVDRDHAFALANDSDFGLSGSVFTSNLGAALDAVSHFDVGVLHVNSETTGADPHVPFGGVKASGYGPKEQGRASREFFTTTTTVYLAD
ncbi:MAG: aldehyde dehydrogenase family protein, partial [Nocardioides sp.]|nr:aldehyde dehydrogenase family protein [Nocardioides sp.]